MELTRTSAFSYECHQCARCCYDKRIQVNPYEIARLARNRGQGTTEFMNQYLESDKPYLQSNQDGSCVFLTKQGCGVHTDRPLVCRLYPLGQRLSGDGHESFIQLPPHPETLGVYGQKGTVEDFLQSQAVSPFLHARDRYLAILYQLLDTLAREVEDSEEKYASTAQVLFDEEAIRAALGEWLDMDSVISHHCQAHKLQEPENLEARMELHISIMESWIVQNHKGGQNEEKI